MNRRYQSLYKTFFVFLRSFCDQRHQPYVLVSYLSRYTTNYYTYTIFLYLLQYRMDGVFICNGHVREHHVNEFQKRLTARTLSFVYIL